MKPISQSHPDRRSVADKLSGIPNGVEKEASIPPLSKDALPEQSTTDPALDALLGRVAPVTVSAGFADRVIQAVHATKASTEALQSFPCSALWTHKALAVAAAIAFCVGLISGGSRHGSSRISTPSEEELLLKALATLEANSGDLALVAQLGEVLEAELSERNSWLEKE